MTNEKYYKTRLIEIKQIIINAVSNANDDSRDTANTACNSVYELTAPIFLDCYEKMTNSKSYSAIVSDYHARGARADTYALIRDARRPKNIRHTLCACLNQIEVEKLYTKLDSIQTGKKN